MKITFMGTPKFAVPALKKLMKILELIQCILSHQKIKKGNERSN